MIARKDERRTGLYWLVWMQLRLFVFERDGYRCLRCGTRKRLSCDHVRPIARGGVTNAANLQTLCVDYNQWKREQTIDYRNTTTHRDKQWQSVQSSH